MSFRSVICAGCSQHFTQSGYPKHIQRTTNLPCQQLHNKQLAYIPQSEGDIWVSDSDHSVAHRSPLILPQFEGDFFEDDGMGSDLAESNGEYFAVADMD